MKRTWHYSGWNSNHRLTLKIYIYTCSFKRKVQWWAGVYSVKSVSNARKMLAFFIYKLTVRLLDRQFAITTNNDLSPWHCPAVPCLHGHSAVLRHVATLGQGGQLPPPSKLMLLPNVPLAFFSTYFWFSITSVIRCPNVSYYLNTTMLV